MSTARTYNPVYVGDDVYLYSDESDGLYERNIACVECATDIGVAEVGDMWEIFIPYWMCDEDNNYNLCRSCYSVVFGDR